MSALDRIIQERKERKTRREAAIAAVMALPAEDRHEVLAELITLLDTDAEIQAQPEPVKEVSALVEAVGSFTDRAEVFVLRHPGGVTTAEVGTAIGQKTTSVDGTLRSLCNTRKTIERRDGKWFPAAKPPATRRRTHRDLISEVLIAGKRPMGASDIISEIQKIDAERKRESLEAELHRMREDGLLAAEGSNGRGALYVLTNGGEAPAQ